MLRMIGGGGGRGRRGAEKRRDRNEEAGAGLCMDEGARFVGRGEVVLRSHPGPFWDIGLSFLIERAPWKGGLEVKGGMGIGSLL